MEDAGDGVRGVVLFDVVGEVFQEGVSGLGVSRLVLKVGGGSVH